jgi:hypothetical protein
VPKNVTAVSGDCLCSIAIAAGFLDCAKLRQQPENAKFLAAGVKAGDVVRVPDIAPKDATGDVQKLNQFRRKKAPAVSIRFVHGSPDKHFRDDATLATLNVSKFVTDKGGKDGSDAFPPGFGFDKAGNADLDAFKVEVVDPKAGSVKVKLEVLRPTFKPDGTLGTHVLFAGIADADKRAIATLECQAINADKIAFRSRYLRLVVDHPDFNAVGANKQSLLTRDLVFDGDEKVEILDQRVRATYVVERCPGTGGPKCQTVAEASIGKDRHRVKMQVHILQDPALGSPVATEEKARRALVSKMRRAYAQVSLGVQLLGVRQVPAPTNLIAVADAAGARAVGGKTISVRVQIKTKDAVGTTVFDQTVSIVTKAKAKPITTATDLAAAINKSFGAAIPPLADRAVASDNPPLVGQAIGSADVLVSDSLSRAIRLVVVTSDDAKHIVTIGRLVTSTVTEFDGTNGHVGTIDERTLVKNYDTGTDRVDSFVVGALSAGSFGEAFSPSQSSKKTERPFALMRNTLIINKDVASAVDFERATIPHEVGHILMDVGHALVDTELMRGGGGIADDRPVGGRKRISARSIHFDDPKNAVIPATFVRSRNATLLDPW